MADPTIKAVTLSVGDVIEVDDKSFVVQDIAFRSVGRYSIRLDRKYHPSVTLEVLKREGLG